MKKKIGITAAVILGILAVCYIGFAVFFQSHFCFGTTIDGIEAGGCSIAKVEQLIEEEIGGYELTLVEREDQTETITASQIGAAPVFHGEIEELAGGSERLRLAGDSVWKERVGTGKNGCL